MDDVAGWWAVPRPICVGLSVIEATTQFRERWSTNGLPRETVRGHGL